ncbi:Non-lysosomal glucosylceramidase [Trichostrongylus colubriformis]|uniref:Non-lysosomal glucosylceramidase n=1 Tax=Trichostrongylus colubriformis TaxID=6319 RepID=A0AAN8FMS0_TRICO
MSTVLDGIGWKVRGDFVAPESHKRRPFYPNFSQLLTMIPLVIRYCFYAFKQWLNGNGLFINCFKQLKHDQYTGVPIGGIGCGSIGTDYRGAFNKFSLIPGIKEQNIGNIKANQFILTVHSADETEFVYQSLLSAADFDDSLLSDWRSEIRAENIRYRGLFPRAWREYQIPDLGLILICEQISPIIPNNYEESSFPVCNFHWTVINESKKDYSITLTFTFRNGTGHSKWNDESQCEARVLETKSVRGLTLSHSVNSIPVTYAVASEVAGDRKLSYCTFDPSSKSGSEMWEMLIEYGSLSGEIDIGRELGIATAARFLLPAAHSKSCAFSLVWHMPIVRFWGKARSYKRRYTRFVGVNEDAVAKLVETALLKSERWRTEIYNWQREVLDDNSLPEWYRSALFNETYYIADGSTMWFEYDPSWKESEPEINPLTEVQMQKYGRFGYMESWEYLMINTYDVHFYASWALLKNWPMLELSLQLDFCDQFDRKDSRKAISLCEGTKMDIKTILRIPHDMGQPCGEPWVQTNAYFLHDTALWRDLNLKFVLDCWRDYKLIVEKFLDAEQAEQILHYFYSQSEKIISHAIEDWDDDDDGMIENSGIADQTYDVWTMSGTSAYCGSLWLAALSSVISMAKKLGHEDAQQYYEDVLDKAKTAFVEKLWNGKYFNFDELSSDRGVIMADQLCGVWFQTMVKGNDLISEAQVLSTLETIYSHNVKMFASGNMGPVNGIHEDGEVDDSSFQGEEVWTGTGYGVASFMIAKDQRQQGFDTSRGVFETCWNRAGLQYQTPEAIYEKKYYRAIGYMRPLAIWAMQHALEMKAVP